MTLRHSVSPSRGGRMEKAWNSFSPDEGGCVYWKKRGTLPLMGEDVGIPRFLSRSSHLRTSRPSREDESESRNLAANPAEPAVPVDAGAGMDAPVTGIGPTDNAAVKEL